MSAFSVPVTVCFSKWKRAPRRRAAVAPMYPCSREISAPSARIADRCRFTGRAPIAQPPGSETRALPARASSGPRTSTEARIVLTRS